MRQLFFVVPALLAASIVVGAPVRATTVFRLVPLATATSKPVYPLVPGETSKYQHSVTLSTTANKKTSKSSFTGVVTSVLSGLGSYDGHPAYAFHATGSASNGNAAVDDLTYVNLVTTSGRTEYVEYGYANLDSHLVPSSPPVTEIDNTTVTYATPLILDHLPESVTSWTEPVANTVKLNDYDDTKPNYPNVLSGTETEATDGSYSASGKEFDVPVILKAASNGTASQQDGPSNAPQVFSFALPVVQSAKEVIPLTETYAGKTAHIAVPDWYPGGKSPRLPLASAHGLDHGKVSTPTTCTTQSGKSATFIEYDSFELDPARGATKQETTDTYVVPGVGAICKIDTIVVDTYDNTQSGSLTSVKTTKTTDVLLSETL